MKSKIKKNGLIALICSFALMLALPFALQMNSIQTVYAESVVRIKATEQVSINYDTNFGGLPLGKVGEPYSVQFEAEGGKAPYTWSYGKMYHLPEGMTFTEDGLLSGTPMESVTGSIAITATDANGQYHSGGFFLTFYDDLWLPTFQTAALPGGVVGKTYSEIIYMSTGGTNRYTYSATGNIPTGMTLSNTAPVHALLSGNPTVAGTYTFTVEAIGSIVGSATKEYTIVISDPFTVTESYSDGLNYVLVGNNVECTASIGNDKVDWTVEGATSDNTVINNNGVLTVGADETSTYIYVRATEKANPANSTTRGISIHDESGKFTITVHNGNGTTTEKKLPDNTFYVYADSVEGKEFNHWEIDEGSTSVTIADPTQSMIQIAMPNGNVSLTAVYDTIITELSATITPPVNGQKVDTNILAGNADAYTVSIVYLYEKRGAGYAYIDDIGSVTYETGKTYRFHVQFTAKEGYYLDPFATKLINGVEPAFVSGNFSLDLTAVETLIPTYQVTVHDGSGQAKYEENTNVSITATVPEGKVFDSWVVILGEINLSSPFMATTTFIMPAEDVEVRATFKDKTYAVTYNEGTSTSGTVPASATKTHGTAFTPASPCLEKEGYTQVGWKVGAESTNPTDAIETYTDNAVVELFPVWAVKTYTITYNAGSATNGTAPASATKTHDVNYTPVAVCLERTGYTQVGWKVGAESENPADAITMYNIDANAELYPVWEINPAVSSVSVTPNTANVQKGTSQQFSASVVGVGAYSIDVTWTVEGGIAGTSISNTGLLTVAEDETATTITVKATSTTTNTVYGTATVTITNIPVTKYQVTVTNGTGSADYEENATVTITANAPAEGKQFAGWTVTAGGVTLVDSTATTTTFTMGNQAVTVVANYENITYTVSFNKNDANATGTMVDVTEVNGYYMLPTCTFTAPSGKQFRGWSLTQNGVTIISYDVTANVTFYAIWEDIPATYTITVENGTVGGNTTAVVNENGSVTVVANTAPEGKEFKGWEVNGSIVSTDATYTFNATETLTIKAVYQNITTPEVPEITEPTNNGIGGGAIVAIVISSVLVLSCGGFALVWFVIKKKKWADLVALFKKNK